MLIDVIGSRVFRRVSEFKNFPFFMNNFSIDQSILSLISEPLPTSMKSIDSSDLTDITIAYRDLNKGQWEHFQSTNSEILMIDLLGELRTVSEYRGSYYSSHTLSYLKDVQDKKLSRIEQFRSLLEIFNEDFIDFANKYEKVFLIKIQPNNIEDTEFMNALYSLLEDKLDNKLIINVSSESVDDIFDAPLEFYHEINMTLKKYVSNSYESQLLFDENLQDNKLSVYMNYLGDREYMYELLKDGKPVFSTEKTTNRYFEQLLDEPGKYRVRVNLADNSIKPRLSKTYEFNPDTTLRDSSYIELPSDEGMWMIDILMKQLDIDGFVGNPFRYPHGYLSYPVLHQSEMSKPYIKSDQLLSILLKSVKEMDHITFTQIINHYEEIEDNTVVDFLNYLKSQR